MTSIISAYSDGVPTVSFILLGADGGVLAQRAPHREFYSASTIKLGVLIAALQAVDAGRLDLEQPLLSTQTFASGVAGAGEYTFDPEEVDAGMAPLGEPMPLREVLRRMIVVSSNEATNMVADLLGVGTVTAAMQACGATRTVMGRLFGDYAALDAGLSNTTTAADLARLMRAVTTGAAASAASTAFMAEVLTAQESAWIGGAVQELDATVVWGSKSGSVTGIYHDVAFINPGGALRDATVLAICTRAYSPEEGQETLRAVASMALQQHGILA